MKLKFEFEDLDGKSLYVGGSIFCKKCGKTFPGFRGDGEYVLCDNCGFQVKNPFYLRPKKHDKRTRQS